VFILDEIRIYDATTHVGYGFPKESLEQALKWEPHAIVAQGTSTDPGPFYLGSGTSYTEDANVKRDLKLIISSAKSLGIPFICSVGGAGADIHVEKVLKLVDEISREENLKLRIAVVSGEIDKHWLKGKITSGVLTRKLVNVERFNETLTIKDVDDSIRIVAQMGYEPIVKALDMGVDGVLTGRALDLSLIAALPLKYGFDKGLTFHMAKILECGALAAEPGSGSDGMFGILRKDCFHVKPPSPLRRCTIASVAAHSFYERDNPYMENLPDGYLDVASANYTQLDEKTVTISGSKFIPSGEYWIKLEGVKLVGYRTICIAGVRDPTIISKIDEIIDGVKNLGFKVFKDAGLRLNEDYTVVFRVYGKDGVMGETEPKRGLKAKEICIIIDVVAKEQNIANSICAFLRSSFLHFGFEGRKTTAGNLAFPFSPSDIPVGPVYIFNIWHKIRLENPYEPFKIRVIEFPAKMVREVYG